MKKEFLIVAIAVLASSHLIGCSVPMDAGTETESEYSRLSDSAASGEYVEPVGEDCESDVDALLAEIEQLQYETALAYQTSREFEQALRVETLKYETLLDEYRVLQTWVVDNQCVTLSGEGE